MSSTSTLGGRRHSLNAGPLLIYTRYLVKQRHLFKGKANYSLTWRAHMLWVCISTCADCFHQLNNELKIKRITTSQDTDEFCHHVIRTWISNATDVYTTLVWRIPHRQRSLWSRARDHMKNSHESQWHAHTSKLGWSERLLPFECSEVCFWLHQ